MDTRQRQGFALIEVLVAVVVLAVGVLGAASMQLVALRVRYESQLLSNAAQMAFAMAERLRANPGQIGTAYLGLDYDAHADPVPVAPTRQCWSAPCDSAAMADADMYDLKRQVAAQLPGGRVRICRDSGLWSTGRLRWPCSDSMAAPLVVKVGWRGKNPDGTAASDADGDYAPALALVLAGAAP